VANGDAPTARQPTDARPSRAAGYGRLVLAGLLLLAAIAGVRAGTPAVNWHGRWRADGLWLVIALELVLAALLVALRVLRGRRPQPGYPAAEFRQILHRSITVAMAIVTFLALAGLVGVPLRKLRVNPLQFEPATNKKRKFARPPTNIYRPGFSPLDLRFLIYGSIALLLIGAILACLILLRRRRRLSFGQEPAAELELDDGTSLQQAVESGRAALRSVDEAQAAIIACYLAMETSLARAGTVKAVAETPAELLARATRTGLLQGPAAGQLTRLFYEARFSTHQLPQTAKDAARQALDAISAELDDAASARQEGATPEVSR
jgi:hypothetical protein